MRKKEIVVLDCGVEVRQEDPGVVFTAFDPGREFAFCIKESEIVDMIGYLDAYIRSKASKIGGQLELPLGNISSARAPSVSDKIASIGGVTGELLADPRSVKLGAGRAVTTGVSVHKG